MNEALPRMIKEHEFWMRERKVTVGEFEFNIYRANTTQPRPESYFEDIETAKKYNNMKDREQLFMDIASAAESGYDFSSRWLLDPMDLSTICTTQVVPIDLNCLLFRNELIIAEMCFKKGDFDTGNVYTQYSSKRRHAINSLLWSNEDLCWSDYNLTKKGKFPLKTLILNSSMMTLYIRLLHIKLRIF